MRTIIPSADRTDRELRPIVLMPRNDAYLRESTARFVIDKRKKHLITRCFKGEPAATYPPGPCPAKYFRHWRA